MTKRSLFLIGLAVALAGAYVIFFTNWFNPPRVEMIAQIRPLRGARAATGDTVVDPVSFAFPDKYRLKSIRVVPAEEEKTSKYPRELWHLISDSNSMPTKVLIYGQTPKGMKPKIPRARPEPLEPDVKYHIYVETDDGAKGDKFFQTREAVKP